MMSNNNNNPQMTSTMQETPRPHAISSSLRLHGGIPVKVEASEVTLREELPHNSWLADFRFVVEGRQVGYALRETGDDLVYVKFPIIRTSELSLIPSSSSPVVATNANNNNNASSSSSTFVLEPPKEVNVIAFTVPKRYLVPVTLPSDGSMPHAQNVTQSPGVKATDRRRNEFDESVINSLLSDSLTKKAKSSKDGKPVLCVVCGAWNSEGGQIRKSGFKCKNCIGVKSVARLKDAYQKLAVDD